MLDRRKCVRSHVLRRGSIVFRRGHSMVDCIVLDLSSGGARLRVRDWLGLPESFELRLESGSARDVEIRFQDLDTMGVQFVDGLAA